MPRRPERERVAARGKAGPPPEEGLSQRQGEASPRLGPPSTPSKSFNRSHIHRWAHRGEGGEITLPEGVLFGYKNAKPKNMGYFQIPYLLCAAPLKLKPTPSHAPPLPSSSATSCTNRR